MARWRYRRALVVALGLLSTLLLLPAAAAAIEPNGTFVQITGGQAIYRVIGGALIHVDSCAALNGCSPVQQISSSAGYTAAPANGSFVRVQDGSNEGWVGVAVGGAFIHVDSCQYLNNCDGVQGLDSGGWTDYMNSHPLPASGNFMQIEGPNANGWVGVSVGGTFIHVDSCQYLNGCPGLAPIDPAGALQYLAAHPLPANGSFVQIQGPSAEGWIGEAIGGSFVHVDNCAPLAGCPGTAPIDPQGESDYESAHPYPANGTFVQVADGPQAGLRTRAAGGALLTVSDCAPLGGCGTPVLLDSGGFAEWTGHHAVPVDGTYLLGLPSNSTWEVLGGDRQTVSANSSSVAVDDSSLNSIPVAQPATSSAAAATTRPAQTAVPRKTAHSVGVIIGVRWRWDHAVTQLAQIVAKHLRRNLRVSVRCHGRGCPLRREAARGVGVRRLLHSLRNYLWCAGDTVVLTISGPGLSSERIRWRMRYGRIPTLRLFSA